jgi:fumarylacetoacetase
VDGANEPHGFGLNHLPYGVFRLYERGWLCVRIGEHLLNLSDCVADGLFDELSPSVRQACLQSTLNGLLSLGPREWANLRERLTHLLNESADDDLQQRVDECLYSLAGTELLLPIDVGDYTDFYSSLHHARRVGEIFRPDNPLLPNYKHVPIGYHGRASSLVVSGTDVRRPWGQTRPASEGSSPGFGPSAALDYEVELAFIVGQGNRLGKPIPISEARAHLFGVALLNDWSARDIQSWEYQPLGPFLGKSFATSLSPWITPLAALEPFLVPAAPRSPGDPQPLAYLYDEADQAVGALNISVSASLSTTAGRSAGAAPMTLGTANTRELYWTPTQMLAHHTSNGCNLRPGDVLATGTISGPERNSAGCLLELTRNGATPLALSNGEHRAWLMDGDEVTLTASCERPGMSRIELGSCTGRVLSALPSAL